MNPLLLPRWAFTVKVAGGGKILRGQVTPHFGLVWSQMNLSTRAGATGDRSGPGFPAPSTLYFCSNCDPPRACRRALLASSDERHEHGVSASKERRSNERKPNSINGTTSTILRMLSHFATGLAQLWKDEAYILWILDFESRLGRSKWIQECADSGFSLRCSLFV
jgi:hypothetical protein